MARAMLAWSHVAYLDETFNRDEFWICAVVVPVESVRSCQEQIAEVVRSLERDHGVAGIAELHGHDLFQGHAELDGVEPWIRVQAYERALHSLASHDARVILRGVKRMRLIGDPHRIAFRYAAESVHDLVSPDGQCLVVVDDGACARHHLPNDLTGYIEGDTGGWRPTTLSALVDDIKVAPSHANGLLQCADLVAYLHQRRSHTRRERDPKAMKAREQHWRIVKPLVYAQNLWAAR